MTEETRTQKILAWLNKEWTRDQEAVKGMAPEERRTLGIFGLVMAIAVILIVVLILLDSRIASAQGEAIEVTYTCGLVLKADPTKEMCMMDAKTFKRIMQDHRAAVERALKCPARLNDA